MLAPRAPVLSAEWERHPAASRTVAGFACIRDLGHGDGALCCEAEVLCHEEGVYGQVPHGSRTGDLVAIILGAKTPYVLRHCGKVKDSFELVGECYMDGMMDGEMMGMLPRMERLKIV